jgi:hypothetical protein
LNRGRRGSQTNKQNIISQIEKKAKQNIREGKKNIFSDIDNQAIEEYRQYKNGLPIDYLNSQMEIRQLVMGKYLQNSQIEMDKQTFQRMYDQNTPQEEKLPKISKKTTIDQKYKRTDFFTNKKEVQQELQREQNPERRKELENILKKYENHQRKKNIKRLVELNEEVESLKAQISKEKTNIQQQMRKKPKYDTFKRILRYNSSSLTKNKDPDIVNLIEMEAQKQKLNEKLQRKVEQVKNLRQRIDIDGGKQVNKTQNNNRFFTIRGRNSRGGANVRFEGEQLNTELSQIELNMLDKSYQLSNQEFQRRFR